LRVRDGGSGFVSRLQRRTLPLLGRRARESSLDTEEERSGVCSLLPTALR
jgi:hypothetical protein